MSRIEQPDQRRHDFGAYLRLARALRELPTPAAPAALAEQVLARVGGGTPAPARYASLATPLGRLYLAYGPAGIRYVAPADDAAAFAAAYAARFGVPPVADPAPPRRLLADVERALAGDRRAAARLPLDLEPLGSFERAVLRKALEIPRGQVRSYGWLAREIGRPAASRAVGRALGRNPIPFLIPCHRVVGSGGQLTGYAFGLPLKERVLRYEGLDPAELIAAERRGERFLGSRQTKIFCFPCCSHARRIAPPNAVPFRGEADALAAGYRPCRACRPVAV